MYLGTRLEPCSLPFRLWSLGAAVMVVVLAVSVVYIMLIIVSSQLKKWGKKTHLRPETRLRLGPRLSS
jgi:hypothetical protein